MGKARNPRHGSMQYWPRRKAKRGYARVRYWNKGKNIGIAGFAGYKAGMTHMIAVDSLPRSLTKGQEISIPVTVIECPPLKSASIKFYKKTPYGLKIVSEVFADKNDKELGRKTRMPKKQNRKAEDVKDFDIVRLSVYTQPKLTGIGKKKPELFEIDINGGKEEQLKYAKENLGKEIKITDAFKEGEQIDVHSITKGKGYQGPVKRFGVSLRSHKSEKTRRGPGSLGGWKAQGHVMYRIAYAGQMGYHQRTEHNKWLLKMIEKPEEINPKGDFLRYGKIKSSCVLLKGSIPGARKRLIIMSNASRPTKRLSKEAPSIAHISLRSKQRR